MIEYTCPLCGNQDIKFIDKLNGKPYCRKCILFKGKVFKENITNIKWPVVSLKYPLTKAQQDISEQLIETLKCHARVLIKAVCGAGKTEIIVALIKNTLARNQRVGIIIPRRDLVIEIGNRLKKIFIQSTVTMVYGGNSDQLEGDIIICTAHQAYRYQAVFSLLIIDEIDAFPYAGNQELQSMVLNSCKNYVVSLSATPSQYEEDQNKVLKLFKRFHNYDLPVPKILIDMKVVNYIKLIWRIRKYQKANAPVFIYVPLIKQGKKLLKKLRRLFDNIIFIYSSMENRQTIMKRVRRIDYKIVITTTILERGVTYPNLQVIVWNAAHKIFNKQTLIQIAGRAGRDIHFPTGDVIFMANKKSHEMIEAIKEIRGYNDM